MNILSNERITIKQFANTIKKNVYEAYKTKKGREVYKSEINNSFNNDPKKTIKIAAVNYPESGKTVYTIVTQNK